MVQFVLHIPLHPQRFKFDHSSYPTWPAFLAREPPTSPRRGTTLPISSGDRLTLTEAFRSWIWMVAFSCLRCLRSRNMMDNQCILLDINGYIWILMWICWNIAIHIPCLFLQCPNASRHTAAVVVFIGGNSAAVRHINPCQDSFESLDFPQKISLLGGSPHGS